MDKTTNKKTKSEGIANYMIQILNPLNKTWSLCADTDTPVTLGKARELKAKWDDDGYAVRIVTDSGLIVE